MKADVRFYTRSGNTRKLADRAIKAIDNSDYAETVTISLNETVDLLFLGCSPYGGKFHPQVGHFLEYNKNKIKKIVLFGTSASGKSLYEEVKKLCEKLNIEIDSEYFDCKGRFMFLNRKRPNEEDLNKLETFVVRKVMEEKLKNEI